MTRAFDKTLGAIDDLEEAITEARTQKLIADPNKAQDLDKIISILEKAQNADAAYGIDTVVAGCDHNYVNNSLRFNGNTYSVTDGTSSDITLNKFIRMAGITNPNSSGYILDTDVTAKDSRGVLDDQVVANYASGSGDSGAPVFTVTSGTSVKILGQHVGKFCEVDLNSGHPNPYPQWCTNPQTGEGALTVFSPWPAVKSTLGI